MPSYLHLTDKSQQPGPQMGAKGEVRQWQALPHQTREEWLSQQEPGTLAQCQRLGSEKIVFFIF